MATSSLPAVALLLTLAAALPAPGLAATPDVLDLHGTRLVSDCRVGTWPQAQQAIEQAARGRSASQLVTLLHTYLCTDGDDAALKLLTRHAPRRILQVSEGPGEKPARQRVDATQALAPHSGRVYVLQLRPTAPAGVALHWQADEACVRSVSLAHRQGAWVFLEVGSACD